MLEPFYERSGRRMMRGTLLAITTLAVLGASGCSGKTVTNPALELGDRLQWVHAVTFSPDGGTIAAVGADSTRTWDANTGKLLMTLGISEKKHRGPITVAFSPDGSKLLLGGIHDSLTLWDSRTGEMLGSWLDHKWSVQCVGFTPDGSKIISSNYETLVRDTTIPDQPTPVAFDKRVRSEVVTGFEFSRDGTRLLTCDSTNLGTPGAPTGNANLWDIAISESGKMASGLHASHLYTFGDNWVVRAALSPCGKKVLTGHWSGRAVLWNAEEGTIVHELEGHIGRISSVAFSPDGKQVLVADTGLHHERNDYKQSYERKTSSVLYDAGTGRRLRTFRGHKRSITCVAFSPDGTRALTADLTGAVHLWDISDLQSSTIVTPAGACVP